jgi:formylglycine-generating enzyme required for sulfatase activity
MTEPGNRHVWPRLLLAGVALFAIATAMWLIPLIRKVQRVKESTYGTPVTNPAPQQPRKDTGSTNGMIWIPGGTFVMGSQGGQADEKPVHEVTVEGFWMDKTEVTNEEFERFVNAAHYVTVAERKPSAKDYPGVPEDRLVAGSIVFHPPPGEVSLDDHTQWWEYVPGANWRHPEGPGSSIAGREKHPVVHICWHDARKYAEWAGKRLPTEAEWEYASRGGLVQQSYVWGSEQVPGGRWNANIWQGRFPIENTRDDNFYGTAPVASFAPNGYGLFDMAGNVWEWCQDWYLPDYYANSPSKNPAGPDSSFDPNEPGVWKKVQRGGSYLCSDVYCAGYRPSARMKASPDTGLSHSGFRCVRSG